MSFAAALTINDVLSSPITELSEEDLLSVYGGTDGGGAAIVGGMEIGLGGVIVGAGAFFAAPLMVAFGLGFAIGGFAAGMVGTAMGY
jgi:hypothetical protein